MTSKPFTTCLWFDGQAEEAAQFYTSVFKDGVIGDIGRYGEDGPGRPGTAMAVPFTINGQSFVGLNGGPQFTFTEAVSFQVFCADQAEVDYYWGALTADGGAESMCGWCKDKYGLSWQVIPDGLIEMLGGADPAGAGRASAAMMQMRKLDIDILRAAYAGG